MENLKLKSSALDFKVKRRFTECVYIMRGFKDAAARPRRWASGEKKEQRKEDERTPREHGDEEAEKEKDT